jgi:FixJ family two-component response regulator
MMIEGDIPQVFVVDDDPSVLTALKRLLTSAGFNTRTFLSPLDFLSAHDPDVPGCAVIDVGMDKMSGIVLQERLMLGDQPRPIIFLTGCDDVRVSVQAMKAGALDYLSKPVSDHDLLTAVENAIEQDRRSRVLRSENAELRRRYDSLTTREREVMAQIVRGRLNKQIAFDLGIVEKTAKVHRGRVMEKMQVRSVAALVRIAERLELARAGEN